MHINRLVNNNQQAKTLKFPSSILVHLYNGILLYTKKNKRRTGTSENLKTLCQLKEAGDIAGYL